MKRILALAILCTAAYFALYGQAVPVTGPDDPAPLFTDKDPVLHKNKQAAMHIVFDLLAYGHWDDAPKYLTERYIQHNPGFASGRDTVMKAFAKAAPKQIPASTKDYAPKIVAVTTGTMLTPGDLVAVMNVVTRPDPRNPGQTFTTTHYDMWRFVDGKADEHWDEGTIAGGGGGFGGGKGPGPGGPPPGGKQ
jgi:predicted SnoaL-like aldol condensation-catalyzing enzyme